MQRMIYSAFNILQENTLARHLGAMIDTEAVRSPEAANIEVANEEIPLLTKPWKKP